MSIKIAKTREANLKLDNSFIVSSAINIRLFLFLKVLGDVFEVRLKSHKKTLKETTHGRLVRVFNYYLRKIYVFNFILSKIKEIGNKKFNIKHI